ncbi:hypothetical protein AVEN_82300-1 [Araneus ventricosus]|uniref:Uncharacterized protein n=1 Tax=Araneus ventricosus TaxID=182803 RepID=A0A4Y2U4J6_ARAVE|nr:hypothetical protein AVEN_82300-1 [Araneus ventricosus]
MTKNTPELAPSLKLPRSFGHAFRVNSGTPVGLGSRAVEATPNNRGTRIDPSVPHTRRILSGIGFRIGYNLGRRLQIRNPIPLRIRRVCRPTAR